MNNPWPLPIGTLLKRDGIFAIVKKHVSGYKNKIDGVLDVACVVVWLEYGHTPTRYEGTYIFNTSAHYWKVIEGKR